MLRVVWSNYNRVKKTIMEITCLDEGVFEMMLSKARQLAKKVVENSESNKTLSLKEWKNAEEAALFLHTTQRRIQSLRISGKLPYSRIEKKIYYHSNDLIKLIGNKQSQLKGSNFN